MATRNKRKKIQIIIDNNKNLGYEKVNWFYYFFVLPIALLLAFWVALKKLIFGKNLKINTFWFDGVSKVCREVKENAAGWRALDIIYNYIPGQNKTFEGKVTDFWNNLKNIKALRNRLRLVQQILTDSIERLLNLEKEVRLISVASGSAQGIINVMKKFKEQPIKAIFLDLDPTALEQSKKLALAANVINKINFVNKSAKELEQVAQGFNPNLIEVVGFIEYRPQNRLINLIQRIYRLLTINGILIISSVSPSIEKPIAHFISNWPMIYRNENQFIEALIEGGFKPENIQLIYEPLKIQKIAICKKNSET